jgi:hypothetical protein
MALSILGILCRRVLKKGFEEMKVLKVRAKAVVAEDGA